jgi:hypothetical protein
MNKSFADLVVQMQFGYVKEAKVHSLLGARIHETLLNELVLSGPHFTRYQAVTHVGLFFCVIQILLHVVVCGSLINGLLTLRYFLIRFNEARFKELCNTWHVCCDSLNDSLREERSRMQILVIFDMRQNHGSKTHIDLGLVFALALISNLDLLLDSVPTSIPAKGAWPL